MRNRDRNGHLGEREGEIILMLWVKKEGRKEGRKRIGGEGRGGEGRGMGEGKGREREKEKKIIK